MLKFGEFDDGIVQAMLCFQPVEVMMMGQALMNLMQKCHDL